MKPDQNLVARFATDLDALIAPGARVGLAVSGGPDSLALLLLAAAARTGKIEAATVDHGLRPESRIEAEMVAGVCQRLAVPHAILRLDWARPPATNIQAQAREARYAELGAWAQANALPAVATAHHADDQAETLLMRLGRGSGLGGLAGIQRSRPLGDGVHVIRPLLDWRRHDLQGVVDASGLQAVDDPSNRDERYARSRVRSALQHQDVLDVERLAASASHLADAEEALCWAAARELEKRRSADGEIVVLDPSRLPRELQRRVLVAAIERLAGRVPSGPDLMRALDALSAGRTTTLAGLKLVGGQVWRLSRAPPRRS